MISNGVKIGIDCRSIVNPERGDTGIGHYAYYLVKNLLERDQSNQYVLFGNSRESLQEFKNPNVQLRVFAFYKFKKFLPFIYNHLLVARWLKNEKCDLMHFPANIIPLFYSEKSVLTVHDLSFVINPNWFVKVSYFFSKILFPGSIEKAKKIIAVSETVKNDLIKKFNLPSEKISVIYNGVDLSDYNEVEAGDNKYGRYILFLGTVEPRKNILILIKAFSKAIKDFPDLILIIAGQKGWKYKPVFDLINVLNLKDKVKYLGYVSKDKKIYLLKNAQCLVFPSFYEGFGLPVLESLAARTPVITSAGTAMAEFGRGSVVLIDPADSDQLAEAIVDILTDHNLRDQLKQKGYQKAQALTWAASAEKTLKLYLSD